jgi:hypothetical protein
MATNAAAASAAAAAATITTPGVAAATTRRTDNNNRYNRNVAALLRIALIHPASANDRSDICMPVYEN